MSGTIKELPVIPPQGGYTAKKCPRAVSNTYDPYYKDAPQDPPTEAALDRMTDGIRFEAEIGTLWAAALPGRIAILDGDRTEESKKAREDRTLELMADPGDNIVIWNPRLPAQRGRKVGPRVSEPDFLVRTRQFRGKWRWAPGDVKHHKVFENVGKKLRTWQTSTLDTPSRDDATTVENGGVVRLGDAMQLAHYQRHLEWLGYDDPDCWGAVIGKPDETGVHRLIWTKLDWQMYNRERDTALGRYDDAFAHAADVIVRAIARGTDPTLQPLVRPDKRQECAECNWRTVCSDDRKDVDNLTVLPGITVDRAGVHYDVGVDTVARLARLHIPTALAVEAGDKAAATAGDPTTAQYADRKVWNLVGSIDQARVWKTGKPHRARGADQVHLERMPIELDVDIEDVDGRIYLIGVNASGRTRTQGSSGDSKSRREFHGFVSWDDADSVSARVLAEFWSYLEMMRSYARTNHWGLRAYHYGPHEVTMLTKVAKDAGGEKVGRQLIVPTVEQLEELFASQTWVDMYPVVSRQVVWPAEDMTLKSIAALCGHTWRDVDPSGANSMAWYRTAIGPTDSPERRAARSRVLAYNEDDCVATLAIRDWLSRASIEGNLGQGLPSVEDLDARFTPRNG